MMCSVAYGNRRFISSREQQGTLLRLPGPEKSAGRHTRGRDPMQRELTQGGIRSSFLRE